MDGAINEFAISSANTIIVVDWDGRSATATIKRTIATIDSNKHMNDAKSDPMGRLVYGVMPKKDLADLFVNTGDSQLFRLSADEQPVAIEDDIGIPNGLTWNVKTKKFYYIDSLAFDVKEYDYVLDTGKICKSKKSI